MKSLLSLLYSRLKNHRFLGCHSVISMDFLYQETKIQHKCYFSISVISNNILVENLPIHAAVVLYQSFISQVLLGYCNSNLILQYNISWREKKKQHKHIKCYLSRRMIFIRSDLSLNQHNKKVSVIFILAKINFAYSKQKMSLSGGLKFSLPRTHYEALMICPNQLLKACSYSEYYPSNLCCYIVWY